MEVDGEDENDLSLDCGSDGSIISIHMKNWLCHENFKINLNKNVNFIVGRNGCGKSAILTALLVGLGSRATVTDRGNNVQSLVKHSKTSASIEIQLRNSSPRAYKRDVYGDVITIIREINTHGSHYKIKSASGELKSTQCKEVKAITNALGIQVENPISILNQDDARSFLSEGPEKMYILFRKATNLDQAEDKYNETLRLCGELIRNLDMKKQASKELEKEYHSLKGSYDQMKSYDKYEKQIQLLQNEYYWSEVAEVERELHNTETQYNTISQKITALTQRSQNIEHKHALGLNIVESLKKQLEEKSSQKKVVQQKMSTLESQDREVQGTLRTAQQTVQKHRDRHNREKQKILDLEQEIDNIQSGARQNNRALLLCRAESAHAAACSARAREATAQHDAQQARGNAAHAATTLDDARDVFTAQQRTLNRLKQQRHELESCSNDSLAVYGNNMVILRKEIEKAVNRGEFSAPPKGPIGDFIKVKDKQWVVALEHILGGSIKTFCVNNASDSRKLVEIMNKVFGQARKPSVSCSQYLSEPHKARGVRGAGLLPALDALQVDDPVVYNHLVDSLRLETVLLVPDHQTAVDLCSDESRVPAHLSKAVSRECAEYYPAPRYRSYGARPRPPHYLQLSSRDRTRQLKSEIQEAQAKLQSLKNEVSVAERELCKAREYERTLAATLNALALDKLDKEEKEKIANTELEQYEEPRQTVLIDELNMSKEKLKSIEEQLHLSLVEEQRWKNEHDELQVKLNKLRGQVSELTIACRNLTDEIDQEQVKIENIASQVSECELRVQKYRTELTRLEAVKDEKQQIVEEKVEETTKLCPRVENPRQKAVVKEELKIMNDRLSAVRSSGLTKVQVMEKLVVVKKKYNEITNELEKLGKAIVSIKGTAERHLEFSRKAQKYIVRQVYYMFQSILTLRGYTGKIVVDSDRRRLELRGCGRGLSGGEHSYCTVAFLLALWDAAEMPFYFLDEFDVFMDDVNRKTIMNLLIDHAIKKSGRQFVFLTPKDISGISAADQVKIHVLPNPRG